MDVAEDSMNDVPKVPGNAPCEAENHERHVLPIIHPSAMIVRENPAPRPLPVLPIELWATVIDQLSDYSRDLRACMSVCHAWYGLIHGHFRWMRHLKISNKVAVQNLWRKIEQNPMPSKHVQRLTVYGRLQIGHDDGDFQKSTLAHLSTAAMMLAQKFPKLECLQVLCGYWQSSKMHKDIFRHMSLFSITRLELTYVTFPSINVFKNVIYSIPDLLTLSCQDMDIKNDGIGNAAPYPNSKHDKIRELILLGGEVDRLTPIVTFLCGDQIVTELSVLCVGVGWFNLDAYHQHYNEFAIQKLLDHVALSLTELELRFDNRVIVDKDYKPPPIHVDSLRELKVSVRLRKRKENNDKRAPATLLTVESGNLTEINVEFITYNDALTKTPGCQGILQRAFTAADCSAVDNKYSSSSFTNLGKVRFHVRTSRNTPVKDLPDGKQWETEIIENFPQLARRGILHTSVTVNLLEEGGPYWPSY